MQIISVTHIRNYRLAIEFDDDSTKTIDLENRVVILEQQLADLKTAFDSLVHELKG